MQRMSGSLGLEPLNHRNGTLIQSPATAAFAGLVFDIMACLSVIIKVTSKRAQ
jgi:hypothetical protein